MGRQAKQLLSCTEEDFKELHRISRSQKEPKRRVDRVRIILACLENNNQTKVAEDLGMRPNTINKWRARFIAQGIKGLDDARRTGKPKTVSNDLRKNILRLLKTPPSKRSGNMGWNSPCKYIGGQEK